MNSCAKIAFAVQCTSRVCAMVVVCVSVRAVAFIEKKINQTNHHRPMRSNSLRISPTPAYTSRYSAFVGVSIHNVDPYYNWHQLKNWRWIFMNGIHTYTHTHPVYDVIVVVSANWYVRNLRNPTQCGLSHHHGRIGNTNSHFSSSTSYEQRWSARIQMFTSVDAGWSYYEEHIEYDIRARSAHISLHRTGTCLFASFANGIEAIGSCIQIFLFGEGEREREHTLYPLDPLVKRMFE